MTPLQTWILAQIERGGETIRNLEADIELSRRLLVPVPEGNVLAEILKMADDGIVTINEYNLVRRVPKREVKQNQLF